MKGGATMADVADRIGEYMLTTVDNPFSPFTQWVEWYAYDTASGYHTCALLARITTSSDDLSDIDQVVAVQEAVDEIVKENVSGVHHKIQKEK
jgi:hypothetical protein